MAKLSRWFRMYGDMLDDPKVAQLTDKGFRVWIELLCLQCLHGDDSGNTWMTPKDLAWRTRRGETDVKRFMERFNETRLININSDGKIVINSWMKRQFTSDTSTQRVRKYRSKSNKGKHSQNETFHETQGETFHVTGMKQNMKRPITDTEHINNNTRRARRRGQAAPVVLPELPSELNTPRFSEHLREFIEYRKNGREPMSERALAILIKRCQQMGPEVSCEQIEESILNGWTGVFLPRDMKSNPEKYLPPNDDDDGAAPILHHEPAA